MNSLPQVDIWLSTRLNKYENRTFKYYSEFRFKTDQSDADFLNQINKNEIRLEVLIDDLHAYLNEKLIREKRFSTRKKAQSKKIVGKYVSYTEVML